MSVDDLLCNLHAVRMKVLPVDPVMCCLTVLGCNLDVHMVAKTLLVGNVLIALSLAIFTRYRSVVLSGEACRSTTVLLYQDFRNVIERNLCSLWRA